MKAGIWVRVSTDQQAESDSPEVHRERCQMYANLKGWEVLEIYNLAGVSGKSVIDHPEAKRMLDDVISGRIEVLIFSKLARLARNVSELLTISNTFKKHNAALVSLGESIDTSTPAGQLTYTIIGALAEWEREEISARVAASVPIRARQGKPTGGKAPWGYTWVEHEGSKRLVVNEKAAEQIRRIFRFYIEKEGNLLQTVKHCNSIGLLTRTGCKWKVTGMSRVITNPIYAGRRRANYSKSTGDGKHWVTKPEEEWVYHDVDPIVEKDIWEESQAIRDKRSGPLKGMAPLKTANTLYGGLLICGCDGKTKMYKSYKWNNGDTTYTCKKCLQKIMESEINENVEKAISVIPIDHTLLREEPFTNTKDIEQEIKSLLAAAAKIAGKKERLLELFAEDFIDRSSLREKFTEHDTLYTSLVNEAKQLQTMFDRQPSKKILGSKSLKHINNTSDFLLSVSEAHKREMLRDVIQTILVNSDRIMVKLIKPFLLP